MAKIFLVGMMGTGKSHWSQKWARKQQSGHYDLDHLIESIEEQSISELFAAQGEGAFRKIEAKTLRWFGEKKSFVLATGGGTACFHHNMEWMNENGITIWLNEPMEILTGRLRLGRAHRPMIKDLSDESLKAFIEKKMEERLPYYRLAQYSLCGKEISNKNFEKIIKEHE